MNLAVVMDMAVDDVGDFFLVVLAKVPCGGLAGDHALVYLFLFFIFFRKLRVYKMKRQKISILLNRRTCVKFLFVEQEECNKRFILDIV